MIDETVPACPICRSGEITRNVEVGQNADAGRIGLKYKDGRFLVGTEELRADLCNTCGTVVRLYVADPRHRWLSP